ncbi:hypothetical protein [Streptomyces sp. NPDC006335]|uniref:hypothetical protein n=1 Tax=Streptomyces sp. NPDC006335 TaxID=3156895 RepID=UPI0033A375B3
MSSFPWSSPFGVRITEWTSFWAGPSPWVRAVRAGQGARALTADLAPYTHRGVVGCPAPPM